MSADPTSPPPPELPSGWTVPPEEKPPRPGVWPAALALGIVFLVWGWITSPIITGVGGVMMAVALAGWIRDLRREGKPTRAQPAGCCPPTTAEISRRKFLEQFSLAVGGIGAAILAVPTVGFIFAPFFERRREVWRSVGKAAAFPIGTTTEVKFEDASPLPWAGVTAHNAAWLRRVDDDTFVAFSINCTHLGCPVRWLAEADLFMCPCHGGVYYADGTVAAGPPPQPLRRYPVRLLHGDVQIQTSPIRIA